MGKTAIVTFLIPTYNEAKNIEETIISVLDQSLENFEVIISDNNSKDGTMEILKKYAMLDPRIKIVQQSETISALENFNFLIRQPKTKYSCLLGGHDLVHRNFLEFGLNYFGKYPQSILVYPDCEVFGPEYEEGTKGNADLHSADLHTSQRILKLLQNLRWGSSIYGIYNTQKLQECRFTKSIKSDLMFLLQIMILGEMRFAPRAVYYRREERPTESYIQTLNRYKKDLHLSKQDLQYGSLINQFFLQINACEDLSYFQKVIIKWKFFFIHAGFLLNPSIILKSGTSHLERLECIIGYLLILPLGIYKVFKYEKYQLYYKTFGFALKG